MRRIDTKQVLYRIRRKINQTGLARLPGVVLRYLAGGKDHLPKQGNLSRRINQDLVPTLETPGYIIFQETPQKVLRRYASLKQKEILEIGGSQACISANAFPQDGANSATVTGLDHITEKNIH